MRNLRHTAILVLFALYFVSFGAAAPDSQTGSRSADHSRRGQQYYKEAFYKKLPQGKYQEAEIFFNLAAIEFQNAIAANPEDVKAHRNLARLHYVRKQYLQAAHVYRNLAALEPDNIDTYIQLALCFTRVGHYDEAIYTLEDAKTHTRDPEIVNKLDNYIHKILNNRQDRGN